MLFLSPVDIPHSRQDDTGTMPVINLWISVPVIFSPYFPFRDGRDDSDDIFTTDTLYKIPSQPSHIVTLGFQQRLI